MFLCFNILSASISFLVKYKLSGFLSNDNLLIIFMATLSVVYLDVPKYILEYSPEFIVSFISYAPILFGMSSKSFNMFFSCVALFILIFRKLFYFSY